LALYALIFLEKCAFRQRPKLATLVVGNMRCRPSCLRDIAVPGVNTLVDQHSMFVLHSLWHIKLVKLVGM